MTSVLRRWAKLARTVRKNSTSSRMSAGAGRVRRQTTALVTFGCGMKHEAGTSNSSSGAAWYWQRMENAE